MNVNPLSGTHPVHTPQTSGTQAGHTPVSSGVTSEISGSQLAVQVQDLKQSCEQWYQNAIKSDQNQARYEDTIAVLDNIFSSNMPSEKCFSHHVDNRLAGLIVVDKNPHKSQLNVDYIVTNPDTRGAGAALIQQAVNTSEHMGLKGQLATVSLTDSSSVAYAKMGFTAVSDSNAGDMVLDPASADRWQKKDTGWVFS